MHAAKSGGNIGGAVPCLTRPKAVFGFISRPSPPGIFILDDGVGLVAKRIEIIPSTTPQMLRISSENSAYSSYQRRIDEVHIIGRVVWFARRL